jgi:hypothetical protein
MSERSVISGNLLLHPYLFVNPFMLIDYSSSNP